MITFDRIDTHGWEPALRGMRNPMNSWEKSDSRFFPDVLYVGDDDLSLMERLANAGTDHRKFMRMITVYVDICAPLYWWKEFDTYKVGTVANSCSTMHKIHAKAFAEDDFSCEHLMCSIFDPDTPERSISCPITPTPFENLMATISCLNRCRELYLETKDKRYWWQMIQLLPSSYNQKRTVMLNYEVLANIYQSRRGHKLDEWREFCSWSEQLPYFKELMDSIQIKEDARGHYERVAALGGRDNY
jgi:hypothetical protein